MPADNLSIYHFFPVAMSAMALAFGTSGMTNCRAVEIMGDGGSKFDVGVFSYRTKQFFGNDEEIWAVNVCRPYTDIRDDFGFEYEEDDWMETLSRIAITVPIIGGVAAILMCLAVCNLSLHPFLWKIYGGVYIVCCILQGIGLKITDSYICTNNPVIQYLEAEFPNVGENFQNDCEKGMGYRMGISAVVFWALAGLSCFSLSSPLNNVDVEEVDDNNTTEVTEAPKAEEKN